MSDLAGGTTVAGNIVWHSGNMGSNSGLDADLLDGKQASAFESAFTKNTAFNKNFGTTSGTVAEGNHTHTVISDTEPSSGLYNGLMWYAPTDDKTKVYLDGSFRDVGGGGATSNQYRNEVTLASNTNACSIGISQYAKGIDILYVYQNSTFLQEDKDYTVSSDGKTITKLSGTWNAGTVFQFEVITIESAPVAPDTLTTAMYQNLVIATEGHTAFPVGIIGFNSDLDALLVFHDGTALTQGTHYQLGADKSSITLSGYSAEAGDELLFVVIKKIRVGYSVDQVDGAMIINGSITADKLGFSVDGISIGSAPPASPAEGDQWYDTVNHKLNYWNGTKWSSGGDSTPRQATAPNNPKPGDQWYDTTENRWKYWDSTTWVDPLKYQ